MRFNSSINIFVVATMVIFLSQTISGLTPPYHEPINDPSYATGKILDDLIFTRAELNISNEVIFQPNSTYSRESISSYEYSRAGSIPKERICVLAGNFSQDKNFQYTAGESIKYVGDSPQSAVLAMMCGYPNAWVAGDTNFVEKTTNGVILDDWVRSCECAQRKEQLYQCCVVALKELQKTSTTEKPPIQTTQESKTDPIILGVAAIVIIVFLWIFIKPKKTDSKNSHRK